MAEEKEVLQEEGIEFGSDKKVADAEFGLIDEGVYEVTLEKLEPRKSTKNGKNTEYMNVTFTIRDDVEQNFKKRKIWYTIFKRDGDKAYNFKDINSIIITQEGRDDYKRHFSNVDEIFQYLIGLHMRIKICVEFNDFKGQDGNIVDKDSFQPSEWDANHKDAPKEVAIEDIKDEDLPF